MTEIPAVESGEWDDLIGATFSTYDYHEYLNDDLLQEGRIAAIDVLKRYEPDNIHKAKLLIFMASRSAIQKFLNKWYKNRRFGYKIVPESNLHELPAHESVGVDSVSDKMQLSLIAEYIEYRAEDSLPYKILALRELRGFSYIEISGILDYSVELCRKYAVVARKDIRDLKEAFNDMVYAG